MEKKNGRPAKKIKPEQSVRLKSLLDNEDIKQKQLSAMIPISQQTISKIVQGHAPISNSLAERIIELFPQYSLQWLLGYVDDRYMFAEDYAKHMDEITQLFIQNERDKAKYLQRGIEQIAYSCGFEVSYSVGKLTVKPNEELKESGYTESTIELSSFLEDVQAFMTYRLSKAVKRGL